VDRYLVHNEVAVHDLVLGVAVRLICRHGMHLHARLAADPA
jgi:hypothetical protein